MPDAMTADRVLAAAIAELIGEHGCHTIILYGSRARGDQTEASDYDLMGLWDKPDTLRIAHERHGGYLDAFLHPADVVAGPADEFLKLRAGKVLVQRGELGDQLLSAVETRFQAGPVLLSADQRDVNRAWAAKTLARIARDDVEGRYRRVMLLYQLLEDYFSARDLWYLGPKAALAWLAEHDPACYRAFSAALAPGAGLEALKELVRKVWEGVEPTKR